MQALHRHYIGENYAVLDYYAASCGNFLQTFRDNLSVHPQGSKSRIGTICKA